MLSRIFEAITPSRVEEIFDASYHETEGHLAYNFLLSAMGSIAMTGSLARLISAEAFSDNPTIVYGGEQLMNTVGERPIATSIFFGGAYLARRAWGAVALCHNKMQAIEGLDS